MKYAPSHHGDYLYNQSFRYIYVFRIIWTSRLQRHVCPLFSTFTLLHRPIRITFTMFLILSLKDCRPFSFFPFPFATLPCSFDAHVALCCWHHHHHHDHRQPCYLPCGPGPFRRQTDPHEYCKEQTFAVTSNKFIGFTSDMKCHEGGAVKGKGPLALVIC